MRIFLLLLPLFRGVFSGLSLTAIQAVDTVSQILSPLLSFLLCCEPEPEPEIKFYFWAKRNETYQYYDLQYGNESQAKEIFSSQGPGLQFSVYVFFHNTQDSGKSEWIVNSTMYLMNTYPSPKIIFSVDYKDLVTSNSDAIKNAKYIVNRCSKVFNWIFNVTNNPDIYYFIYFIGHGIGANLSYAVTQNIEFRTNTKTTLTALDPYIASSEDLESLPSNQLSQYLWIKITNHLFVGVYHTSTCSYTPVIPACDSNLDATMGDVDYFINGGAVQPGCSETDLICSNVRVTLLEVELFRSEEDPANQLLFYSCPSFKEFQAEKCSDCATTGCAIMQGITTISYLSRFYGFTNANPIYGRGENGNRPSN